MFDTNGEEEIEFDFRKKSLQAQTMGRKASLNLNIGKTKRIIPHNILYETRGF